MSTPTEPPALANPNIGMDNFITGLKEAGMEEAVTTAKEPEKAEAIAPAEPAPKKEAPPAPAAKPEPVKETPKEVTKTTEEEEKKWPRNKEQWDAYKKADKERLDAIQKERDELKADRDRVKAEIEQVKKQGPSPELEALKKEKEELDQQLRLVAVERHPKFNAYFENKVTTQIEMAKRIVGTDKAAAIAELLKAPDGPIKDRELTELMDTLSPYQQSRLGGVMNDLDQIKGEREMEIQKARANYDTIQKQQKEEAEKQQQQFTRLFDDTVKAASDAKAGSPAFQKREGDEAWNAEVDKRIETARQLVLGSAKPESVARAALDAVALPTVLSMLKATLDEKSSLESQIKELQSATPKVEAGKPSTTTESPSPISAMKPGHTDPMSAIGGWMKTIQQGQE